MDAAVITYARSAAHSWRRAASRPTDPYASLRLRTDLVDLDADVALVWDMLESDLRDKAAEIGGTNLMQWLQEEGSKTAPRSVTDKASR